MVIGDQLGQRHHRQRGHGELRRHHHDRLCTSATSKLTATIADVALDAKDRAVGVTEGQDTGDIIVPSVTPTVTFSFSFSFSFRK